MKQDLLWVSAMQAIYGENSPILTQSERKKIGKLLNELRELNVTPEELTARAKRYAQVMPPGCTFTLAALVLHWGRCAPQKKTTVQSTYTPPPSISLADRLSGARQAKLNLPPHLARRLKV